MEKHIFLAFDLGATSGRSILGTVADGKVEIKELTRFPNAVTELHGKYYWNLMGLYQALREGLVACNKEGIVPESIGIDTWGVDVVPIGEDGSILSMPRAYRDPYTVGMPERFFDKIFTLREYVGASENDLNIDDPYGYGKNVYSDCAKQINDCIDELLVKLEKEGRI